MQNHKGSTPHLHASERKLVDLYLFLFNQICKDYLTYMFRNILPLYLLFPPSLYFEHIYIENVLMLLLADMTLIVLCNIGRLILMCFE